MSAGVAGRWRGSFPLGDRGWRTAFILIIAFAAVLRLHDLPTRGTWDADQGHDMIVLSQFVEDGQAPLLGPPTSIGDFHHGALYYYVLAPAAWLGGGDPAVVVAEIGLLGVVAVGLVMAVARAAAGVAAGVASGLLMAASATAVDESTFLWNPNLVAFGSSLAIAGAWRAWTTRRARWWLVAAIGQAVTMQAHVLGWAMLLPLAIWLLVDVRRRLPAERRAVAVAGLASAFLIALTYTPLIASELQTGFHETRAALAFLATGGQSSAADPLLRLVFVTLRILSWPLTGLLTSALAAGVGAGIGVVALLAWRIRVAGGTERQLAKWIGATIAWSCIVLGIGVSSLASVTPLPVDHYHAFVDPLIYLAAGLGISGLWRLAGSEPRLRAAWVGAIGIAIALVSWNLGTQPPPAARDGGYPAAAAAAGRIGQQLGARSGLLVSLPAFKTPEAYVYPLRRLGVPVGGTLVDPMGLESVVVLCDDLFVSDCGGPAEDAEAHGVAVGADGGTATPTLIDRFRPAQGRTLSLYLVGSP